MSYFYTDDARRVLVVARRHAARLQCDAVGIEHLLLALIEYGRGPVEEAFFSVGVTPGEAWAHWTSIAGAVAAAGPTQQHPRSLPYTPGAARALGLVFEEERRRLRESYIGSEHLLLGVLRQLDDPWAEPEPASELFKRFGVDPRRLREELLFRIPIEADPASRRQAQGLGPLGISPYMTWLAGD